MIIIFNPSEGADIKGFNFEGEIQENHLKNSLKQYPDAVGNKLIETFGFCRIVDKEEAVGLAAKIKEDEANKPKEYICEFDDEKFKDKDSYKAHMKEHKEDDEKKGTPEVDTDIIPVAGSKKAKSRPTLSEMRGANIASDPELNIPNGKDKDGVEWYGDGYTEGASMAPQTPIGEKGHFGG